MKKSNRDHCQRRSGFTLLELLVVLAILAAVTTVAFQSVSEVQDERAYDDSRQAIQKLETVILGDDEPDGFVSDMGRLPHTVASGTTEIEDDMGAPTTYNILGLHELSFASGLPAFDLRNSTLDPEVTLPTGWRGPYLKLPINTSMLLDGWKQPMQSLDHASPNQPLSLGYHRLRDAGDNPIIAAGQPISIIRHLGANGARDAADEGVNRDLEVSFVGRYAASVKVRVEILDSTNGSPATADVNEMVKVVVFAPNPADASTLAHYEASTVLSSAANFVNVPAREANEAHFPTVPVPPTEIAGSTIGQRAVRAYLHSDSSSPTAIAKSVVKYVTLRPGVNFIPLTIYR